jgi:hypothetical protein
VGTAVFWNRVARVSWFWGNRATEVRVFLGSEGNVAVSLPKLNADTIMFSSILFMRCLLAEWWCIWEKMRRCLTVCTLTLYVVIEQRNC